MKTVQINTSITIWFLTFTILRAQVPQIEWQRSIGSYNSDNITTVLQTPDGGYMFGGYSSSGIGGNKTEDSRGLNDYWIVKTDAIGIEQWDRTIGGSGEDILQKILQTPDGGYLLAGNSASGISGDKTVSSKGAWDFWLIKIDASGFVVWQKSIGGNSDDRLNSIVAKEDGGYLIGGNSRSGISGDKTETGLGYDDCWLVKTDQNGNIEWDKSFGGDGNDDIAEICLTDDGNIILGADSESGISGNKSEVSVGMTDFWLLKIDYAGNIIWQNTIGGKKSDHVKSLGQTPDGGYIIGGISDSGIYGDKTEKSIGSTDYWIVKINSTGSVLWQNTIGGTGSDVLNELALTSDGGFIASGFSQSGISGDKIEKIGYFDAWILKLDADGIIIWQKVLGGNDYDGANAVCQVADGGYIVGAYSTSGISGNKTVASYGLGDFWIIKFLPENLFCVLPETFESISADFSAEVSWAATDSAMTYRIRYRENGSYPWSFKYVKKGSENSTLNGLLCNTEYEWQLMSICAPDGFGHSDYSASQYFTTLSCRLGEELKPGELSVYPNPSSNEVHISLFGENGAALIRLFNSNGENVLETGATITESFQMQWNSENLSAGIYQLQILVNGNSYINKIIINK